MTKAERRHPDWLQARVRVQKLVRRYRLPDGAGEQFMSLIELLATDPLAPTSVRDPAKAAEDHLADSLVALELAETITAPAIADLGAGAGFPGLALAIALPRTEVHLVESNVRKCAFIERAAALCEIANAVVVRARVESWAEGLRRFDLVTARALAPLSVVAEYAAPVLRPGGTLVVWRGRRDPSAETAASSAAAELGLELQAPLAVRPYRGAEHRHLHRLLKIDETPSRFPRRPGMARKRPLGDSRRGV